MASPRALCIDLGALERGERGSQPLSFDRTPWSRFAAWSGSALGLACLHERARRGDHDAFVIAVGEAVRSGLPTAARAAVQARAPLSGLYAEGHVGGELGARLARVADALLLEGRCSGLGSVLVLEADGACRLLARPALRGAAPAETVRALEDELGPCAVLAIGPGGERGLPFASLAVGQAPPSFVGRGGLGAVFGRLGLKALCLRAEPLAPASRAHAALLARLRASPRLAARAGGGTLELFDAWAARGELAPELGHALAAEARARAETRHGCKGCPTPCGWVFERADGARQGARFGASQALGVALGLETLDEALHVLALCDRLGLDAKEVGAVLAVEILAEERGLVRGSHLRGDRDALARRIEALVADERTPGRAGAARRAAELGLAGLAPIHRGQAVRDETNLATLLGQCVASGGADPMRSFPFLLDSADPSRLVALLAPLPVPDGALDATRPAGKGRLVFWHENLIAAVDMSGFCAFSAAGLLADELCSLDELAQWILPEALAASADGEWRARAPGERLLAAGANLVLARRELNRLYGQGEALGAPSARLGVLSAPGMLAEYLALRGLDAQGRAGAAAVEALGSPRLASIGLPLLAEPDLPRRSRVQPVAGPGRVSVVASGALAASLGARLELDVTFPATVERVLRCVKGADGPAPAGLFAGERLVPAVWRAGERLAADDPVAPGDVLELVTVLGGG